MQRLPLLYQLLVMLIAVGWCSAANCPTGWRTYKDDCYLFHSITATMRGKSWQNARHSCQLYGADLADVRDKNESDFIFKSQSNKEKYQHFWLGISDTDVEGVYKFVDGTNVTYFNWNKGEPNNYGGNEDCVETHYDGTYNDNACGREFGYICKKKKGAPTPTPRTLPPLPSGSTKPVCDAGWIGYGKLCYLLVRNKRLKFEEAAQECRDQGGDLVMPKTKDQQAFIANTVKGTYRDYWIGLSDRFKEGTFYWVDRTPLDSNLTNWAPREPSNAFGGEDCVQMYSTYAPGKWNDNHCSATYAFICQKPVGVTMCPDGWEANGEHCYQFNVHPAQKMSWAKARQACRDYDGADLVSITSEEEQKMIYATVKSYGTLTSYVWTGLNDNKTKGVLEWSDGTHPVKYHNWAASQPAKATTYAKFRCVGFNLMSQGLWRVLYCGSSYYFVCKKKREYGRCHNPLGMENFNIANDQITASSQLSATTPPFAARWNHIADLGLDGAWCAAKSDQNPFLQIDLGQEYKVAVIGIQGKANANAFVKSFYVSYSDDGARWNNYGYNPPSQYRALQGNYFGNNIKGRIVNLNPAVTARYLKIVPLMSEAALCMRIEIYGCKADITTSCGKNWIPGVSPGVCYQFGTSQLTWTAARANCLSVGGDLLSITSNAERNFINQKLNDYKGRTNHFWIGLNDRDAPRYYLWSDGSPLQLVSWNGGNPKDKKDRLDCVAMTVPTGDWFDDSCYTRRPYICKRQARASSFKKKPFNSNWRSTTDHYWPLQEVVDKGVLGTRTGQAFGNLKTDSAFLNRKHLVFDGSTTYLKFNEFKQTCVSVPQNCLFGLTVSFLIKLPSSPKNTNEKRYILDIAGQASKDAVGWTVYVIKGKLGLFVRNQYRTYNAQLNVFFGKWINIAFTFSLTDGVTVYIDGVQRWANKYGLTSLVPYKNEEVTSLFVGSSATSSSSNAEFEMMSLAIWERQLAGSEIKQVFNAEMRKCGPGWIMFGQYCYRFETQKRSWAAADVYCKSMKGELVSIHSGVEQALITLGVGSNGILSNAWIGLNSRKLNHVYNWTDGSEVSFTHWAGGEPNNMFGYRREDCGEAWSVGMWNDEICYVQKAQICKKEKDVLPDTPVDKGGFQRSMTIPEYSVLPMTCPLGTSIIVKSAVYGKGSCKKDVKSLVESSCANKQKFYCLVKSSNDVFGDPCVKIVKELNITYACSPDNSFFEDYTIGCPAGWKLKPGSDSCYKLFYQEKTWADAQKICQSAAPGADLVSIASRSEQVFLSTLLVDGYVNPEIWNGLNDHSSPGEYLWSDNTPVTYSNWYNGQPDDSSRQKSCVKMKLIGIGDALLWIDDDCNHKHSFICKVLKKAATRPPPVTTPKPVGSCAAGWTRVGNKCFRVFTNSATWLDARDNCATNGSKLASITSRKENEAVFNLLMKGPGSVTIQEAWIGLTDKGIFRGQFWVDESPVSFTLWDSMEPNSYLNMKACSIMASNGNWRDTECSLKRPYVCKTDIKRITVPPSTTPPKPTPTQDPNICPTGWKWWSVNGKCYFFKNTTAQVDWYSARKSCMDAGGNLVSIGNKDEQNFVASYIKTFPGGRIWIGLNDLSNEGGFTWSDGTPSVFFNFEQNQPDDWHGMEDCVEIRNYGNWNDAMCSRKFPYICKRNNNSVPVGPTVLPTAGPVSGYCDPGWLHYRNKCYKIVAGSNDQRKWKAARDYCRGISTSGGKGDLVSIHSSYENAFLNSRASDSGQSLWIGFSDLQIEKQFGWSDQSAVTYTNWNYRQPDDFARSEDCVELAPFFRTHGQWNDLTCDAFRGFICQSAAVQVKPTGQQPTATTKCPQNYVGYGGDCYSFKSTPATWEDARKACRKENAKSELVSVHSPFEQDHVFSYFVEFATDSWTGLHRLPNDTKYRWSDNTPTDYTYWAGGVGALPSGTKGCVYAHYGPRSNGRWYKSTCDRKLPYLCKLTKAQIEYKPDYPGTCPTGWLKKNKYCYLIRSSFYNRALWAGARETCRGLGGDLASIHSNEEQAFLHYQIRDQYRSLWIGLNDRAIENGFVWSDESPFDFTYWNPKEPNDKGGVESCVEVSPLNGRWNDLKCSQLLGYICKKNLECSSALGMENKTITDDQISASSFYGNHFPQFGRLNFKGTTKGWCTNQTNAQQYLQIDLGMTTRVTQISMQGVLINKKAAYVSSYMLYASEDNVNWKPYSRYGKPMVLLRKGTYAKPDIVVLRGGQTGRYFRINPVTWTGDYICMMVELYGCKYVCESPLGVESKMIKDSAITASSANPKFKPSDGRLNLPGGRAWCALTSSENQWLQVDLAGTVQISKVATQGLKNSDKTENVVTAYKLSYSDDGKTWTPYRAINGEIRIFSGNNFADSTIFHRFSSPVSGRYVRFYPLNWKGGICLRVDVFGCPIACDQPLGLGSGAISDTAISASSSISAMYGPSMGRLNKGSNGKGAWCAATSNRQQYLEVNMGKDSRITAIATQGLDAKLAKYVTDYSLQYSMNGKFWSTFAVNGKIQVLQGNSDGYSSNKVQLKSPVHGRYVRVNPLHWAQGICMRIELYGCVLNPGVTPTEEPPPPKRVVQVGVRFPKAEWKSELSDRTSKEFKDLANKVEIAVTKLYLDDYAFKDGFESITVTDFRPGSVIADFVVIFRTDDTKITDPLKKAVKSGKIGDLQVDEDYLKIKIEGTPSKQVGKKESSGLSRGGKIALVVFFVLLIVIILAGGAFWYWKKRRQTNQFEPKSFENPMHYDAKNYNISGDANG